MNRERQSNDEDDEDSSDDTSTDFVETFSLVDSNDIPVPVLMSINIQEQQQQKQHKNCFSDSLVSNNSIDSFVM